MPHIDLETGNGSNARVRASDTTQDLVTYADLEARLCTHNVTARVVLNDFQTNTLRTRYLVPAVS